MTDTRVIFVSKQFEDIFERVTKDWPADAAIPAPRIMILEDECTPVLDKFSPPSETSARRTSRPPRRVSKDAPSQDVTAADHGTKKRSAPDDYAILLYTSGSINIKGVMHSQRGLLSNQQAAGEALLVTQQNEVFIAGLPLSHSYGLLCGFVPLSFGSIAVYAPSPRSIAEYITASREAYPSYGLLTAGVPDLARIMNQRIIRSAKGSGKNSPPVKRVLGAVKYGVFLLMRRINYCTAVNLDLDLSKIFFKPIKKRFGNELKMPIGGGPTDSVTEFGLRSIGIFAAGGYGTTEMAPLLSSNVPTYKRMMSGSVGQVPPGMEVKIIDGEVCGRGPNMMLGYLKNDEATKKAIPGDGWYHTGDRGYYVKRGFAGRQIPVNYPPDYIYTEADKDCFLILKGRVDNQFANQKGENIFPEVIESILMGFPIVSSCRVYENPPTHVMAQVFPDMEAIELELGKTPTADEIKSLVSQIVRKTNVQLQSGCGIDDFEVQDADFERNAFGKIKRTKSV